MWLDLSKKMHWLVTLMGSCFFCIFFITLIANYFNIKIYHDSPWGIFKIFIVLFFIPAYVGYKSMFIFGYVKEQSAVNIYAENFWGFSPITMLLPALAGGMFANSLYKEIKNKANEQTRYEQPQYIYAPQPSTINGPQPNYFDQFDEKATENKSNTTVQQIPSTQVSSELKKNDVDWNQSTPVEGTKNVQSSTQSAEQAHYDAILKVHPDALQIVKQPNFQIWIDAQPPEWRKYYNDVADTGNAEQVINMLNDYKNIIFH